jgi:hypothetical protein
MLGSGHLVGEDDVVGHEVESALNFLARLPTGDIVDLKKSQQCAVKPAELANA